MEIRNEIHSGRVILSAETGAGLIRTGLDFNPNGNLDLYHSPSNAIRLSIEDIGSMGIHSNLNTDTDTRELLFLHQDGTERGTIGHLASNDLSLINRIPGGALSLQAEQGGGGLANVLFADPDGNTTLYGNNVSGLGAWDRTGLANTTGGFVIDSVANVFPVGFNILPGRTITANQTIDGDFIGRFWEKTAGGAITITLDNDAAIPNGGTIMVANLDTEAMSVDEGSGVTLQWLDGSGATVTGNRTVAGLGSVISIRKRNSTNFQIWGNGIS